MGGDGGTTTRRRSASAGAVACLEFLDGSPFLGTGILPARAAVLLVKEKGFLAATGSLGAKLAAHLAMLLLPLGSGNHAFEELDAPSQLRVLLPSWSTEEAMLAGALAKGQSTALGEGAEAGPGALSAIPEKFNFPAAAAAGLAAFALVGFTDLAVIQNFIKSPCAFLPALLVGLVAGAGKATEVGAASEFSESAVTKLEQELDVLMVLSIGTIDLLRDNGLDLVAAVNILGKRETGEFIG